MLDYQICRILPKNQYEQARLTALLAELNLRLDEHLDYTLGLYSLDNELLATASCYKNTLRCLAVKKAYQGEGLLAPLVSELIKWQFANNYKHIFVYTKSENMPILMTLGFHLITQTKEGIAFLENKANAFSNYLRNLQAETLTQVASMNAMYATNNVNTTSAVNVPTVLTNDSLNLPSLGSTTLTSSDIANAAVSNAAVSNATISNAATSNADVGNTTIGNAAIIMNANPFTKGHLYLVEEAAKQSNYLHLFVVRANESVFPFAVRKNLLQAATSHIPNIIYHDTSFYMVSTATFPAYFQKDVSKVTQGQASLEASIFIEIAKALNIKSRFLGTEPYSKTTAIYNQVLARELANASLCCKVIPRKAVAGNVISASKVRQAIKDNDWELLKAMLPPSTLLWLCSKEAATVIAKIRQEAEDY